jgi:hypothetical protein
MKRLVAVAAALLATLWVAPAQASASTSLNVSRGSVTLTVGPDTSYGEPSWTAAFSGTFAVGGATYVGSATGSGVGGRAQGLDMETLGGSSSTGTLTGNCLGTFAGGSLGFSTIGQPTPVASLNFTGVANFDCLISINGAPGAPTKLIVGLAPTTNPRVFNGLYAGTPVPPDATTLPALPIISYGTADAVVTGRGPTQLGPSIGFDYRGQITLGSQTFQGLAFGSTAVPAIATSVAIPPFQLTDFPSSAQTLSATCSGQWLGTSVLNLVGAGVSVLTCNGSANGGPPGTATLVSVYRLSFFDAHNNQATYSGVFAGI